MNSDEIKTENALATEPYGKHRMEEEFELQGLRAESQW